MRRACLVAAAWAGAAAPAAAEPGETYAEAGSHELGGAVAGAVAADLRSVSVAPAFGRFVADRLLLSAVVSASYASAGADRAWLVSALVEPGYHVPLGGPAHAFLGFGIGAGWLSREGGGLVVAPRVGLKLALGASVVLIAIGVETSTHSPGRGAGAGGEDFTLADDAVTRSARVAAGWAVRW